MKKTAAIVVLSVVILASFGFAAAKLLSFKDSGVRAYFAASPLTRRILGLHYDGDAAADYLGGRYPEIQVEVDSMDGLLPGSEALDLLVKTISEVIGKPAVYFISDSHIPYEPDIGPEQIGRLADSYRNPSTTGKRAPLYLLCVSRDDSEPQLLGRTYQESGILLYEDALKDFVAASSSTLPQYEASTALHEFGHQIGLGHNEGKGCLMTEAAEKSHVARERPKDVITDFCPEEIAQIQKLKLKFFN